MDKLKLILLFSKPDVVRIMKTEFFPENSVSYHESMLQFEP